MQFVCRLGTPEGRIVEELHDGADATEVKTTLERRGFHVFQVKQKGLSLQLRGGSRRQRRIVKDPDFLIFNQELAGLLRAGLPLLQCLDIMLERQKNPAFRDALKVIRDKVKSGVELSDAFQSFGSGFPALYASALKAGERSGELEVVIRRYMRQLKLVMETRKKVVSALFYPALLISLSITMVGVMVIYVIPRFKNFYDALDVELPFMTQAILDLSLFLRSQLALILLAALVAAGVVAWRMQRTGYGRRVFDRMRLRIPIAGTIIQRSAISEFCRALATLLGGGLPLVPALDVAVDSVTNQYLKSKLEPLIPNVREGLAFWEAMDRSEVFTDIAIDMVKVGEATGSLDEMLTNVSDFLDDEVETHTQRLLSLVEPVMLVIMGVAVATLLLAMYLPLFSVLGQLQG